MDIGTDDAARGRAVRSVLQLPSGDNNGSPGNRWHPTPISFPETDGVRGYKDITPRVGAAYDVFGKGKTSLKVNIGKYLESANNQGNYQINNPASDGRNGRFEGYRFNFQRRAAGTVRTATTCRIAISSVPPQTAMRRLGQPGFGNASSSTVIDQNVLSGWASGHGTGSSAHRSSRKSSAYVRRGWYNRRWFGNFFVTHNLALSPADFDKFALKAPSEPKLPDGGGYPVTFYDVEPAKFGQVNNYYTFETDYAPARTSYWHGVDINVNGRLTNGLTFQGGTSSGVAFENVRPLDCAAGADRSAERGVSFPAEDRDRSLPRRRAGPDAVPRPGDLRGSEDQLQLAGTFRSVPGTFTSLTNTGTTGSNGFSLNAVYTPTPAEITVLSRPQSNANAQYNLLLPGQMSTPRLTYFDIRLGKDLEFGGTRRGGNRPVQPVQQQHSHGAQHELDGGTSGS